MDVLLFVLVMVGFSLPYLAPRNNRPWARRMFWCGVLIATISAFFIGYPPNLKLGLILAIVASGVMLFRAYLFTPYIKIRGKIYAHSALDSQPDPPVGGTSSG